MGRHSTDPTRLRGLYVDDRSALDQLLDEVVLAQVGLIAADRAVVIPTAMARDGDRLLIHGSTGSGWMTALAAGAGACVSVTALDGVIVARSTFESSFAYRSATVFGHFVALAGEDKKRGLTTLAEKFIPGRNGEVRGSTARELAATLVLSMPIEKWTVKISSSWPEDPDDDVAGPAWAGIVPLGRQPAGPPLRPRSDARHRRTSFRARTGRRRMTAADVGPRIATADDRDDVVSILTGAFHTDPTWSWAFPDASLRAAQFTRLWGLLVDGALRYPWVWLTPGDTATSVWIPPDGTDLSDEQEALVEPMVVELLGADAPRVIETMAMFDEAHPRAVPHST